MGQFLFRKAYSLDLLSVFQTERFVERINSNAQTANIPNLYVLIEIQSLGGIHYLTL